MDYYIAGNAEDERPYLFAAVKGGVKIIGTDTDLADIFNDVHVSDEVTKFKNQLYNFVTKNFFEKFPPHEYEFFLFHQGLGETLRFIFWLPEYRKHTDKKILTLCIEKARFELLKLCPPVDEIFLVNADVFNFISIYFSDTYNIKNFLKMYCEKRVIEERDTPSTNKFDSVRAFLGLNSSLEFKRYPLKLPDEVTEKITEFFNSTDLKKGKTVFIATDGYYFSTLFQAHHNFWVKLVTVLKQLGYDVVTNSSKEKIPGTDYIFLPLTETAAFIGLCGNLISIPTGFIEASCTLNGCDKIKAVFLYPNLNDLKNKISTTEDEITDIAGFRAHGDKLAENRKEGYVKFLEKIFLSNIKVSVNLLGSDEREDDELILKIVSTLEN